MDLNEITDKYYELTNAICDAEVTIVGEDGVERRAAYGDLLVNMVRSSCVATPCTRTVTSTSMGRWMVGGITLTTATRQTCIWYCTGIIGAFLAETLSALFVGRRSATNGITVTGPQLSK